MIRILLICMGNICRSPLAEGVVRVMAERAGLSSVIEVDSAGTHAFHVGELPDPRIRKVAASHGYDLSAMRARRVNDQDFRGFDHILAMDRNNLECLRRSCPTEHLFKLGLFLEYSDSSDSLEPDEIPDPYYGGAEGFEKVLALCEQGARGLVEVVAKSGMKSQSDCRKRR